MKKFEFRVSPEPLVCPAPPAKGYDGLWGREWRFPTHYFSSLRAGSHFRCYKRCGTSGEAASLVPDLSPARSARRLVSRGFAARATSFSATSFITTKTRACSQAITSAILCTISYPESSGSLVSGLVARRDSG